MIVRKKKLKEPAMWDPIRVLIGAQIFLNQYCEDSYMIVLYYIAQYVRSTVGAESEKKKEDATEAKEKTNNLLLIFSQLAQLVGLDLQVPSSDPDNRADLADLDAALHREGLIILYIPSTARI